MLAVDANILMNALYLILLLSVLRKNLVICQLNLLIFSLLLIVHHQSAKPRMTPVSSVMATYSYEASLFTINRLISYESGIVRQDFGI